MLELFEEDKVLFMVLCCCVVVLLCCCVVVLLCCCVVVAIPHALRQTRMVEGKRTDPRLLCGNV